MYSEILLYVGPPINLCNEDTPVEYFKFMCNRFTCVEVDCAQ